jgi:hypothetical protein
MKKFYKTILSIFVILFITMNTAHSVSCAAGRAACFESCRVQNCATGYCMPDDGSVNWYQRTCTCTRCNQGPGPIKDPIMK